MIMKRTLLRYFLPVMALFAATACDNDDSPVRSGADNPVPDEDFTPVWTHLYESGTPAAGSVFIGDSYTGVNGTSGIHDVPQLYVGAVYPGPNFPTALKYSDIIEVPKRSAVLTAGLGSVDSFSGESEGLTSLSYAGFMKNLLASSAYSDFISEKGWTRLDYALCDVRTVGNLSRLFPDNGLFARGMAEVVSETPGLATAKSLTVGRVVMQSLTVGMDVPPGGVFDDPQQIPADAVCVSSLTYGATAYFVIVSDRSYDEVCGCFKEGDVAAAFDTPSGKLRNSTIITFIIRYDSRNADVTTTFSSLTDFLARPFTPTSCGYPIYIKSL